MIPQYRAKSLDSDEFVEGYLIKGNNYYYILNRLGNVNDCAINQNTLAISFDNGETFDDIEECKKAIDYVKSQAKIWKD